MSSRRGSRQNSPLLRVPEDILFKIFTTAIKLESAAGGFRLLGFHVDGALSVRLSHVCSLIREIVLDTPLLWSTIDPEAYPYPAVVAAFLERSRDSPLSIDIPDDFLDQEIFDMLLQHIDRWEKFSIAGDDHCGELFDEIIEQLRPLYAPKLTHLKVGSLAEEIHVTGTKPIFTKGTPLLKSLNLMPTVLMLPPDLRGVTQLIFYSLPGYTPPLSYDEFCAILKAMPSLNEFQLTGEMVSSWPPIRTVKPLPVPHLKALRIVPSDCYDCPETLQAHFISSLLVTLTTDSLQRLCLGVLDPDMLTTFLTSLRNGTFGFPKVKELLWHTDMSDPGDIKLLLQSLPALEVITLERCEDDSILQTLSDADNEPTETPLLCKLHTINMHPPNVPLLREIVSSRANSEHPIRSVMLLNTDMGDDVAWLVNNVDVTTVAENDLINAVGWES